MCSRKTGGLVVTHDSESEEQLYKPLYCFKDHCSKYVLNVFQGFKMYVGIT